jgi:glycosyltransferase involved in cell wall biosynthesis
MKDTSEISVSIIIPVYNVEKYIGECIDSVLNQEIHNIEVICVENGSTDGTLKILQDYSLKDNRIKLLSYNNRMGPSFGRNIGMSIARGKYIYFLDSDDLVKPDIFTKLIACAEINAVDCVYFDSETLAEEGLGNYPIVLGAPSEVFSGQDFFAYLMDNNKMFNQLWRQFWKREFLKKIGIKFYEDIQHAQDVVFSEMAMLKIDRCIYLNEVLHTYRRYGGSWSRVIDKDNMISSFRVYCRLISVWSINNYSERTKQLISKRLGQLLESCRSMYYRLKNLVSENDFEAGFERHLFNALLSKDNDLCSIEIDDEGLNKLRDAGEIIVYGAGFFSPTVINYLINKQFKIDALAVTKKNINTTTIFDLPIYEIEELVSEHKDAVIVMGVKLESTKQQIIDILHDKDIYNIVDFKFVND